MLTYNVKNITPERIVVILMSIFDKADFENVSNSYIRSLVIEAKKKHNMH